jgi:hypothetical protein
VFFVFFVLFVVSLFKLTTKNTAQPSAATQTSITTKTPSQALLHLRGQCRTD